VCQDPQRLRAPGDGRDGCRVPMPWSDTEPPFGFGPGPKSWLPAPASWAGLTVETQLRDPGSTLALYRAALRLRRERPELGDGSLTWHPSPPHTLVFSRGDDLVCAV